MGISRRAPGDRRQAHRRHGDQPRRLLCAARRRLRATLRLLHRLGRAVGLRENLAPALRAPAALRYPGAVGRLAAYSVGGQCNLPGGGAQAARAVQARWRGAENRLPVRDAAWRRGRTDSPGRSAEVLRRGRLETEDDEGLHARGRRLPPLPDRQPEYLFRLYVGLARAGAAAGAVTCGGISDFARRLI